MIQDIIHMLQNLRESKKESNDLFNVKNWASQPHIPSYLTTMFLLFNLHNALADPVLELRGGPGFNLLAQLAFLPWVISFFAKNKGGGGRPLGPPPLDPPL